MGYDVFRTLRQALAPLIGTTRLVFALRHLMVAGDTEPGGGGDPRPPEPQPYDPGTPTAPPPPPPPPPEFPGPGTSNSPDAKYYAGEDEFILGQDGVIYQRQREGFRTVGWRAVGRTSDIAGAAAAAGVTAGVLEGEVNKQIQQQNTTNWQLADSGFNGLTNQQLQQQVQGGQFKYDTLDQQWNAAQSGVGGLTNYELQQRNKTAAAGIANNDYAWKNAAASWWPTSGDQSHTATTQGAPSGSDQSGVATIFGSAAGANPPAGGATNQWAEQQLQGAKDQYGWGETQYGLTTQQAQHALEDKQRNLQTQQTTFNLGQEAQRQTNEAFKANQLRYEQAQGASSRDVSGFGWAAMNPANATRLAGQ
jgi:hypothetical protein